MHPRITDGGFWHKKSDPLKLWLDGFYSCDPFYEEQAETFHDDATFNDITSQFVLMEHHARAMGLYGMAMGDVLDHFPASHLGTDSIYKYWVDLQKIFWSISFIHVYICIIKRS